MNQQPTTLLGSSPTLAHACNRVRQFFHNDMLGLQETTDPHTWAIHRESGTLIEGCRIRLVKGRYRFERLSTP